MVCQNCGNEFLPNDRFCKVCGSPVNVQMNNTANYNPQTVNAPPKKKRKWIWIIGGVVIAFIAFVMYFGSPERNIDSVKGSTLTAYDYGKTIGTALDNWFGGTEEWYTMEDAGQMYVCARGECKYMTNAFEPTQIFLFRVPDNSDYFVFEGAYDENGDPIFSNTGNIADSWAMELYDSYLGVNLHDYAIKAAFGDEETLQILEDE